MFMYAYETYTRISGSFYLVTLLKYTVNSMKKDSKATVFFQIFLSENKQSCYQSISVYRQNLRKLLEPVMTGLRIVINIPLQNVSTLAHSVPIDFFLFCIFFGRARVCLPFPLLMSPIFDL
jgi:hypothetical protein